MNFIIKVLIVMAIISAIDLIDRTNVSDTRR
jgi:hypothetical protein